LEWLLVGEVPEALFMSLEEVPLPAVMLDAGGAITGLNSRFASLLGTGADELKGTADFAFVDPGDRDRVKSLIRGMAGGCRITLTTSLLRRNREGVGVRGFWSAMGELGPQPPRYLGLFVEIPAGEHRALPGAGPGVDLLSADASPVVPVPHADETAPGQIDRAKRGQVIHTIVFHDTKNRLSAIHGYTSLLRESLAGSGFIAYLDKLEEIASDIEHDLGAASMFFHLGLISPQWQNLREVVGRAASREASGGILMDGLPGSLWCFADPLFPRVFSNLFENARRHGERVTAIRISTEEKENGLVVSVEDDGIGIPADQKERIFLQGFGRHTGIGLFLVKEILAVTGISISETGKPGRGARFEILVPRGKFQLQAPGHRDPDMIRAPAA
jgi:two-component sensor histidine kinase